MKTIQSKIIPYFRDDIDTDLIIGAEYLKCTGKDGLGKYLFARLDDFPKIEGAQILIAGENFGCGSSREHAAWALFDFGIRVIIAPSFADIFHINALNNGILLIVLNEKIIGEILRRDEIEVDLIGQKVIYSGKSAQFEIDPYRKKCLIEGLNDMTYLLANLNEIDKFNNIRIRYEKNCDIKR